MEDTQILNQNVTSNVIGLLENQITAVEGERVTEFYYSGFWNDLLRDSENIDGYILEYGGMPNDVSTLPTATVTIVVLNNSKLPTYAELKASYNNRLKQLITYRHRY